MDYLKQPALFKIKKVLRYIRIYGVQRTYIKVIGQLHMRKKFNVLPAPKNRFSNKQIIGIIGCGNYSFSNIAYYLNKTAGKVIAACMDIDINRAVSMSRYYKIPVFSADPEKVIKNDRIQLIYIASNHASHAEYAIEALKHGKNIYIEKPHVVSEEQLVRLVSTMRNSEGKVFLGFNRPGSGFGKLIREYLNKEPGIGMYNWFVIGHDIDRQHWYNNLEEGGRILGNYCHWTDFILKLIPQSAYPIKINPTCDVSGDGNVIATYTFAEGSIAVISFSAKGHTFEGVRERFSAHKGNCLIEMHDFKALTVEIFGQKKQYCNFYRDHGHKDNILATYESVLKNLPYDREEQIAYIWNTGWLFLKTKEAIEKNIQLTVESFETIFAELK